MSLTEEIAKNKSELTMIENLLQKFPDMKKDVNRWKTVRYYTPNVNATVDKVTFSHSCGCCGDAPLYAYPYKEVDGVAIHSDPVNFYIGDNNQWCGENPADGWQEKMKEKGIPQSIIDDTQRYLDANPPRYDTDE